MEQGRGRERERTRGPERRRGELTQGPLTVEPVSSRTAFTQLPPVGSHHQILEQPIVPPQTRQESSDIDLEKKAPELKKPKLEPPAKDEQTTQMDEPMPRLDHSAAFGPHEVFDLTAGDEPGLDELQRAGPPARPPDAKDTVILLTGFKISPNPSKDFMLRAIKPTPIALS